MRTNSIECLVKVSTNPSDVVRGALDGLKQTPEQKNLSSADLRVVSLASEQLEKLRQTAGVRVYFNSPVSIPPGENETRRLVTPGSLREALTVSIPTHGADKLHKMGVTGSRVYVAVIDTGVSPHKDLGGGKEIVKFYDVYKKAETAPVDGQGHGTHCSGIVAASGKLTGMAPGAKLIGIKVLDDSGSGSLASVMAGIDQAIAYYKDGMRPMVASMSLGGPAAAVKDDLLVAKVKEAAALGIRFAIAAGNSGPNAGTIGTPGTANAANVLTVAANDTKGTVDQSDDTIAPFSSRGDPKKPELGQDHNPDISANGTKVLSLAPGDKYATMSGTSMATPHIAGAYALLMDYALMLQEQGKLSVNPDTIPYDELLQASANNHANIPPEAQGAGELRVDKAAELLLQKYGK